MKRKKILKLWKLKHLSIEGRIVVFSSLAISKLTHLALVTETPISLVNLLTKIYLDFIWKGETPNIKKKYFM